MAGTSLDKPGHDVDRLDTYRIAYRPFIQLAVLRLSASVLCQ
jgi:hypothetical protein